MEETFTPKKLLVLIVELILMFILAVVIVGVLRQFVITPFGVSGASMSPTFRESGDKVFVYRQAKNLKKGDVVVFYRPPFGEDNDEDLNPASKKVTFSDFMRNLPILGVTTSVSDEDEKSDSYVAIIKRIVACPGDTVSFVHGELYVNNQKEETYVFTWTPPKIGNGYTHTMQEDEYFVLGDNRGNSIDSEDYGPIKRSQIVGRVVLASSGGKLKTNFN